MSGRMGWNWEEVCGPRGLRPWDEAGKDLGLCFQQVFLLAPTLLLLAAGSGYYVGFRRGWVVRGILQERVLRLRALVALALAFLPVVRLYELVVSPDSRLRPAEYLAGGAACLAWLVHFGYVLALKRRLGVSPRGPVFMLVLWSLAAVLAAVSLRSRVRLGEPFGVDVAILICHAVYLVTLIPSEGECHTTFYSPCLVGSQYSQFSEYFPLLRQDDDVLGTAMQGVTYTSKLLFYWVEPLFQRGIQRKLKDPDDLFDLPSKFRCGNVGHKIDKALIGNVDKFQQFEERSVEPFMRSGYGSVDHTAGSSTQTITTPTVLVRVPKRHNVSLFRALHSCFGWEFYSIGILKFVSDAAGFAGPLLLNRLVTFVEDPTVDIHMGYLYAGGLLVTTLASALCNAHFNMWMSLVGLKMKAAIISTILRKTLSVTSTELNKSFSVGEITNFMSTDTDRIVSSCPSFHALWSIPLQMFVTLYLLYLQVGISFLAGIAFSIVLIPINKCIAKKIGELSAEMMHRKDKRVSLMSEVIRGIRTIKLHVWEDYFISKITDERTKELKYLKGRKYLDAMCVVFWATTPVLMSVLTLSTYVLIGNKLDAATVFTAVALMNMLIGPLNAFPWVLNGLTEAWVSIKRIQNLLELTDTNDDQFYDKINTNSDEDNTLIFKNAKFSWSKPAERRRGSPKSRKNKGKSKKRISKVNVQRTDSESSNEPLAGSEPFSLVNLNLEVRRGQLIGVVGRVGSGKTSLLHCIIAEMLKKDGEIQISDTLGGFGYVSQKPWLQRGTIRDNILFGKRYEEAKFRSVIDACGLTDDMSMMGWNAAVGEGGCTLSGGQRARVALARAVYQDKQVYLLDDILSAVDVNVAHHIYRKCIMGLLADKTRILVTHSVQFLVQADRVLFMENGTIKRQGPPDVVLNDVDDFMQNDSDNYQEESGRHQPVEFDQISLKDDQSNISLNSIMKEEDLSSGSVDWWVIGMYLGSVGSFLSVSILLSLLLMQISQNFTFLWLSYWVNSENPRNTTNLSAFQDFVQRTMPEDTSVHENLTIIDHGINILESAVHKLINTTHNLLTKKPIDNNTYELTNSKDTYEMSLQSPFDVTAAGSTGFYLAVYMGLAGVNFAFTFMRAFLFAYGGVKAATRIHRRLLKVVTKARMKFYDVTPAGRILNRFSSDTYTIDDSLPFIFNILLAQVFGLIGALVVTVYGLPWVCLVLVPLMPIYHWLQHRYRLTSRELKRLHSITLSPIYSHFNDTLLGLTTIRAFRAAPRTMSTAEELVDLSQRASLASAAASQWLSLRLQFMGVIVITGAAAVAVAQRHFGVADAGLVGLAISYALSVTSQLASVMNAFPETERELIAVERVGEYVRRIEPESALCEDTSLSLYLWPSQGVICAKDVVIKYREHLPPALKGVSFETRPAEKVGVVGRTGAGKSSIFAALLRLCELHSGAILIDSVDISKLSLSSLRSRVAIIPQEPFIFAGSIRENLDPLGQYIESEVWLAIEKCGAREIIEARGGLDADATDLSQGHMQLLCLARAILQNAKILCIDEATANVDQETDRLIQETIRCSFRKSTVITIAHRISTILDSDRVLVMGDGQVLEFDAPDVLLQNPESHFYHLVNREGAE